MVCCHAAITVEKSDYGWMKKEMEERLKSCHTKLSVHKALWTISHTVVLFDQTSWLALTIN